MAAPDRPDPCHRILRKQRSGIVPIEEAADIPTEEASALDRVVAKQQSERLTRAIDRLPESERIATRMLYYEHLSHAEIAHQLKLPPKTIKSRLHAARGRLRISLTRQTPTLERLVREARPRLSVSAVHARPRRGTPRPGRHRVDGRLADRPANDEAARELISSDFVVWMPLARPSTLC
ncbi:TPA: hypothetical protein DCE37_05970 [Candidatus Latescibacteria bacterium]|nr:hypothetical protein [Candidatus Latescibacterota bacterium]